MKKILVVLLTMTMVMTALTACGKKDNESDVQDPNAVTDGNLQEDQTTDTDVDSDLVSDTDSEGEDDENTAGSAGKNDSTKPSTGGSSNSGSSNSGSSSTTKPQTDSTKKDAPKGTPSEIIEKIYGEKNVDLPLMTMDIDLSNADALKSATGLSSSKKIKAAAYSEAKIGSQAYSLVVVRVKDKKDTETIAEEMINGIDQRKWICVEADDLRVAAYGDLVMLFMVDSALSDVVTSRQMVNAFKAVCGGSLDVSIK